jgi:uncharacterized protein (DUF362 family)
MAVSIRTAPGTAYPDGAAFSPSESYPEYQRGDIASDPNLVYGMVRDLFAQLGLDKENFGAAEWNPLRGFVPEGSRVFVLCNFVYHQRPHESRRTFTSKCIHGSVLRALIDYVLLAAGPQGSVAFGNSPLQGTDWARVLSESGADRVAAYYRERGLPVRPVDLRLYVIERSLLGHIQSVDDRGTADGVELDLGSDSLLTEIPGADGRGSSFRISDYDPRRTQAFHAGNRHVYVIHREVLESDVVISLSKLKTHEKVGITCGLKGFVGSVGHKDCLAHHRFGSPRIGGDEYPAANAFLHPFSRTLDWVNRGGSDVPLQKLAQIGVRNLGRVIRRLGIITGGAWHGNDTCWRMALDLARILHHADRAGVLHESIQRRHLSLIDGIVAGECNGPLDPRAADAGTLAFGDDVAATDKVACRLMAFDPEAIPLVRESFRRMSLPVTSRDAGDDIECVLNGAVVVDRDLEPVLGRPFEPPAGWRDHLRGRGDGR